MKSFVRFLFIQILAFNLVPASSFATGQGASYVSLKCSEALRSRLVQVAPQHAKRSLGEIKSLKFMTYNVENLSWNVGKYERTNEGMVPAFDNNRGPQRKSEEKIAAIRKIIQEESPDIAVLEEVEGLRALEYLAQKNLNSQYQAFLINGNDDRGVGIGYLVKTDLPIFVEHITNKDVIFQDPVNQFKEAKLFSRDLPALILRTSENSDPFMIVFGNHAKSQRDRPGDPKSMILRTIQYQMAAQIVQNYHQKYPGALILLAGDFNADGLTAKELDPIRKMMPSAFEILNLPSHEQITQTFHPFNGPTVYSRLDDIRILNQQKQHVSSVRVIPYKDNNGNPKPPAQSFQERSTQPSDHRPIVADINLRLP